MNKVDIYEQRIHDIFPELSIENISLHDEGLDNDIIEVNQELIFRFPKHEQAVKKLDREVKILKLIKNYITLNIPKIFYEHHQVIGYFMMCGTTLKKNILPELDEQKLNLVVKQLATFLKELHNVPKDKILEFDIPESAVGSKFEDWVYLSDRLQEKVLPELSESKQTDAKKHFVSFLDKKSNFEYKPKIIHGNLGSYHILFDKKKKCVSGVIDFGTAGLGDPAIDLATLIYSYGEDFVSRFYQFYPELKSYLERARFYIETFKLRWLLSGITNKEMEWFLSNLGSAKDINLP